jgi:hypothetical protein
MQGRFKITQQARELHGNITCEYTPIVRGSDYSTRYDPPVKPMLDDAPLSSDFFKVRPLAAVIL